VVDGVSREVYAPEHLVNETAEAPTYQFRPRMLGSDHSFRLGPDSLEWSVGSHSGRTAYPMITYVRLGYRPSNLGSSRFTTEIWSRNTPRIEIASASNRSLVAMENHGAAYKAFIRDLHLRIANSGADCRFEAGFAPWRWWPMVAIGAAMVLGMGFVSVRAIASGDFRVTALILALVGLLAWQMVPLVVRNRPRQYDPRQIPDDVLPGE
jgi:hypothetical protein